MLIPLTILAAALLALPASAVAQSPRRPHADGPAVRRLEELLTAVQSGSTARMRALVRAAYAPEALRRTREDQLVEGFARLHDRSRGLEIDSIRATRTEAAALLRTTLTGLHESLSIRVEPTPPHRILGDASFSIKRPKHPLSNASASDAERVREIDRLARSLTEADVFSGVVLVAKGDSVLYVRAFGDSDRDRRAANRVETPFALASITKTLVSVAIAKLTEEGKLSWNDSLGKFLPDFPAPARDSVRVKHLVTHTSGLREFRSPPDRPASIDDYMPPVVLAQSDSLLYQPGTRSVYANSNYVVLGKIIERASGRPYYEYIREHIFRPAGMQHAEFDEPGRARERLALAYGKEYTDAGVRFTSEALPDEPNVAGYPAPYSGAYSTASDLFRFAQALRAGRILRPETFALIVSPRPEAGNWSYGFDILDEERTLVGHGGSWIGMSNSLDMFIQSGYTSVILSNYTAARSPLREAIWAILP